MQGQRAICERPVLPVGHKPGELEDRDYKGNLVQNLGSSGSASGSNGCFRNQGKWIRSGVLGLRFHVSLCIFVYMDVHFPKDRAIAFDRFSKDILTF